MNEFQRPQNSTFFHPIPFLVNRKGEIIKNRVLLISDEKEDYCCPFGTFLNCASNKKPCVLKKHSYSSNSITDSVSNFKNCETVLGDWPKK